MLLFHSTNFYLTVLILDDLFDLIQVMTMLVSKSLSILKSFVFLFLPSNFSNDYSPSTDAATLAKTRFSLRLAFPIAWLVKHNVGKEPGFKVVLNTFLSLISTQLG